MVNRAAVVVKYKEPFIKWINETDPPEDDPEITLDMVNEDRTVYLISEEDGENLERWISLNYKVLFENELEDWITDESYWPKKRSKKLFHEWIEIECHTMLIDTGEGPIFDDEP